MTDRLLNYLTGCVLIALFILVADPTQRIWILVALGLSLIAVTVTLLNNSLSIDGAAAALIVGTVALGLGGVTGAVLLLFFFFSSYGLSKWLQYKYGKAAVPWNNERRKGGQVWANAFWFVLFLILYTVLNEPIFQVTAAAAIAAASSDTWASVTGERLSDHARLVTTFREVESGTDGAVTWKGTLSGLIAAILMALLFLVSQWTPDFRVAGIILISAFSGCVVDSYLGAIFQVHKWIHRLMLLARKLPFLRLFGRVIPDNNGVNFLATGIAALIAFLLY